MTSNKTQMIRFDYETQLQAYKLETHLVLRIPLASTHDRCDTDLNIIKKHIAK